jgi:hypothetical protein
MLKKGKLSSISLLILAIANITAPVLADIVEAKEISFFRFSPRLVKSNTSFSSTNALSRYNFYIDIPAEAENNLSRVIINQQPNLEIIKIYPEKTKVFLLTDTQEILVSNSTDLIVNKNENTNQIIISLSESIPAGSNFKIVLRAINPLYDGIYQFGVTVEPEGANPQRLYLGNARFHFYFDALF